MSTVAAFSLMRARRARRSAELDHAQGLADSHEGGAQQSSLDQLHRERAAHDNSNSRNPVVPGKSLLFGQQQTLEPAHDASTSHPIRDPGNGDDDTAAVVVREKSAETSDNSVVDGEDAPVQTEREKELDALAQLVKAEIERSSKAQEFEALKRRTTQALEQMSVLRAELGRAEAAVIGGKKKRDADIAEREDMLRRCEEETRTLKKEGTRLRLQLLTSVAKGVRLKHEIKKVRESLSCLSAWDEEKIELESEVERLKAELSSVTKEGENGLELAQKNFNVASAMTAQKMQLRLTRQGGGTKSNERLSWAVWQAAQQNLALKDPRAERRSIPRGGTEEVEACVSQESMGMKSPKRVWG